jgi:hypothetical protein
MANENRNEKAKIVGPSKGRHMQVLPVYWAMKIISSK